MELTSWSPLIGLGGVAVGALGAWVTQWLTRRQTSQLSVAARKAALRDDRRDAIYAFLEAIQAVDKLVETRDKTGHRDDDDVRAVMHTSWYRLNCINVVGSQRLKDTARDLNWRMHCAIWDGVPDGYTEDIYQYMRLERDKFIAAATEELYSRELYEGVEG